MKQMKKNCRVLKELIRIRFQRLMMFRLGFWGPFFVDGSMFLIQLLVFRAVYSNVDRIGSWGQGEVILYIGTFSLLNAVNMVVYFFGVIGIPDKIRRGEMDLYLTKPVSPLLRISFENINPGSLPLVAFSLAIIVYGVHRAGLRPDIRDILAFCFWVFLMQILYYDMEVIIRSAAFYLVTNAKLEQLEDAGLELCMKLPGVALYGVYKFFFYCILPYGVMATLPVQRMIGEMSPRLAVFGVGIVCVFTAITVLLWKHGVRHYNSAGS